MPDEHFLAEWKKRSTLVCKPCWELKYCPYGPLVEQSPILRPLRAAALEHHNYLLDCLESGFVGYSGPLSDAQRERLERRLALHEEDPTQYATHVAYHLAAETAFAESAANGEATTDVLDGPLPPIHRYRVPFPFQKETDETVEIEVPADVRNSVDEELTGIRQALASGVVDNRKPLDDARRAWFEKQVASFNPSDYPEEIPGVVSDSSCNIFGHICPIVYVGEDISETSDARRRGRYIPFAVKMRVVRRDTHTCQQCTKHLRDDEVEFDHVIPVAKGGSSEEYNIRLTCFACNRNKSDTVEL